MTFSGDADICPGLGWNHDAVDVNVQMKSHFDQCSKILINDIGSWYGVFKGDDVKWFQDCEDSEDVTADFTTWNFYQSVQDTIVLGTREPDSVMHCKKLPLIGSSSATNAVDILTKISMSRIGSYLDIMNPKST